MCVFLFLPLLFVFPPSLFSLPLKSESNASFAVGAIDTDCRVVGWLVGYTLLRNDCGTLYRAEYILKYYNISSVCVFDDNNGPMAVPLT